ncbi:MAG: rbsA 3 [Pseudonocardiales bacterium]|nr:rbsA 3 [Pseudonocardiales bacterium]
MIDNVLEIEGISKSFGGQVALDSVDIGIRRGEIHALVGQNGSGKSTVIKLLAGFHKPDPGGVVRLDGEEFELGNAAAAFAGGLRFVHQDLALVPALGAIDNLALGRGYRKGRGGGISWREERLTGRRLLDTLGFSFDLNTPVSQLAASQRTGIAIARAIEGLDTDPPKVLVLDEPTASLPVAESRRLFEVIRRVNEAGVAIVYVSHRFGEIFEIADRVTVLRNGRNVATRRVADIDERELTRLTIGRTLELLEPSHEIQNGSAEAVLAVEGVNGRVVRDLALTLHPGHILGIAGVTGSGREEVVPLLSGATGRTGAVLVHGRAIPPGRPDLAMAGGMAFVPAERLANAAFADMTLRENLTIGRLGGVFGLLGRHKKKERAETEDWLERLDVVPRDPEARLVTLSGGNQQKVILARALRLDPAVLVVDEPTQGVDVGAKAAIHAVIEDAAHRGAGVLVASTELEELLAICDRIAILVGGHLIGIYETTSLDLGRATNLVMQVSPVSA